MLKFNGKFYIKITFLQKNIKYPVDNATKWIYCMEMVCKKNYFNIVSFALPLDS